MATVAQCVFKGGTNDGFICYGVPQPLYIIPILCPDNTKCPQHFIKNGVFQLYEVYSMKRRANGQAIYNYQGSINLRTVKLLKANPHWKQTNK